tara:strand:+ start:381 stop:1142 length:762 start_codon:yes stop_codon:yes gene_type:complete
MNNKRKYKLLLKLSFSSGVLFLIFSSISMFFYKGGSMWNNPKNIDFYVANESYSHFYNFFSDLGLLYSWTGKYNIISVLFFNLSLLSVAFELIIFYYAFHLLLKKNKRVNWLSKVGQFLAILSAIGFVMVGFTPSDTYHQLHMVAVNLAFRSFLIVMLIYTYVIFKTSYITNYLSVSYFILFCIVGYYIYVIASGPTLPSVPYDHIDFQSQLPIKKDLLFHVVSQKLVVYGLTFCTLWQLHELSKNKYIDFVD